MNRTESDFLLSQVFLHPEKRQVTCVMVKFEEKREWVGGQANTSIQYMVFENQRTVSFYDIASEYILTEQKFIKNAKNGQFGDFLKD